MSTTAVHKITTGIEGVNLLTDVFVFLNVLEKGDEWNGTFKTMLARCVLTGTEPKNSPMLNEEVGNSAINC